MITLLAILGGLLALSIGYLLNPAFPNYRELSLSERAYTQLIVGLALYFLGIYITALVIQQSLKQKANVEPSFLVLGGLLGLFSSMLLLASFNFMQINWLFESPLFILLLTIPLFLGTWFGCKFEIGQSNVSLKGILSRALIPFMLTLILVKGSNNSFPGVMASPTIRQQWAYQEFGVYGGVVNGIKACKPIIDRVGNIEIVAPAQGENYFVNDPRSSGHQGRFILDIIGEQGTGVAKFGVYYSTFRTPIQFTYQDQTYEIPSCYGV